MSRNDGRPRSVVTLRPDPMPIRHTSGKYRYPSADVAASFTGDKEPGGMWEWDVRPGFIQDEEVYPSGS